MSAVVTARQVAGYSLERPLGHGGMADVWLGRHRVSGGLAAVKLLRERGNQRARDLFLNEQRALLRLSHPHIVPLFDLGADYIVTAFIEGQDLGHLMRTPMSARRALAIATAIGSALAAAHARAVVHLDVKPGNILVDSRGTPFLADFGIAWLLDEPGGVRRRYHAGTGGFMAPEQAAGQPGPASDQYALALTLLALLTERSLRAGVDSNLRQLPPDLAGVLEAPLRRALDERPDSRFPDMAAFVQALRDAEVTDRIGTPRRTRRRTDPAPFRWAAHPETLERHGEELASARYALSTLEVREGEFAPRAVAFRGAHGYRDFGWSVYGRRERLGALDSADAYARAAVLVVLLHGAFTSRDIWHDMAIGIARDNPTALVLVPDLIGFGVSRLAAQAPGRSCTPVGMMRTVQSFVRLLGLEAVPLVLVGHSFSATALLSARRGELGPILHRLCLSPILPFASPLESAKARAFALLAQGARVLPAGARRALAHALFARDRALRRVAPSARQAMAEAVLALGLGRIHDLFAAIARLRPAPATELADCTVVSVPDDPLVPDRLVSVTVAAAGVPPGQHYRLAYGGHFPQLEDDERPEWTARNVHELVHLIDAVLERTLTGDGRPSGDAPASASAAAPTVFEP